MIINNEDSEANQTLCSPRRSFLSDPKSQKTKANLVASPKPDLPQNHVLIRVDKFGFSANNVTYEVLGEHPHFRYFDFHPAQDRRRFGIVPVWGFGTVLRSTVVGHGRFDIREGERLYGYFAPTRYLELPVEEKSLNSRHSFYVARPQFPPDRSPYNQIIRCDTDPQYTPTPEGEDLTMIYRPLFWTAYWCEDWLHSSNYRGGVGGVVISSASAKTAFCLAYLIGKRVRRGEMKEVRGLRVVGLTSARNVEFTKGLGLYDVVVEYGELGEYFRERDVQERWLYIDVAGNEGVNGKIKDCLGQRLATHVKLGFTNLSPRSPKALSKKEAADKDTEMFFMPEWLATRRLQLSVKDIIKGQNDAWAELMRDCKRWVELERVYGAEKVMLAYERVLRDGFEPMKGYVWSMWDGPVVLAKL